MSRIEISILRNSTGEKIKSEDDLRDLIKNVIIITGISVAPADIVVSACWKIMDHFSSFTRANFMEAFELNEAGIYAKRVEHFNAFLPAYMSEVLNCYRGLKNRAELEYKRALAAQTPEPVVESGEDCFKSLKKCFDENENELPRFWNWQKVFLYLEEVGEIALTLDEKNKIYSVVKNRVAEQKKLATDLSELKSFDQLLRSENLVKEARKYCVQEYFKKFSVNDSKAK